ncbi:unnamed protein product, partial [Laminaria digitata]
QPEYFGQYGEIAKLVINHHQGVSADDPRYGSASAYITFRRQEDAWAAICSVDGFRLMGRTIRASFGTSKYCNSFLRNLPCNNPDCLYLHALGDEGDRFTKDEVQLGLARHGSSFAFKEEVLGDRGAASGGGEGVPQPTNPVLPPPCPMAPPTNGIPGSANPNASANANFSSSSSFRGTGGVNNGNGRSNSSSRRGGGGCVGRGSTTTAPCRPSLQPCRSSGSGDRHPSTTSVGSACAGEAPSTFGGEEGWAGAQPISPLPPGTTEGRPRLRRRRGQRGRRGGGGGNGGGVACDAGGGDGGGGAIAGVGAGLGAPCAGSRAMIGCASSAGVGGSGAAGYMDGFSGHHHQQHQHHHHHHVREVDERFLLGLGGGRRLASASMCSCLSDMGSGGGGGIERTLSMPLTSSLQGQHSECGGGCGGCGGGGGGGGGGGY